MSIDVSQMLRLPTSERLELIEVLWDSLVKEDCTPECSADQLAELDRRLDELQRDGSKGLPWPEVRKAIESRSRIK